MKFLCYPLLVLATAGLLLSVADHLCALLNLPCPLDPYTQFLPMGLFLVWMPTVLLGNLLAKDCPPGDFWKVVLRGAPVWMRRTMYSFIAYTIVIWVIQIFVRKPGKGNWSVSCFLMSFFAVAVAVLYSVPRAARFDDSRRCPQGHRVSARREFL